MQGFTTTNNVTLIKPRLTDKTHYCPILYDELFKQ